MTLKLIDLFETKFIGEQNIEYIELFKNIEVHPILNIIPEIRKQFILLVSIYHNNLFVINIFKKLYKNKEWKLDKLQYINSFCLSPSFENKYNWKDLENPEFYSSKITIDGETMSIKEKDGKFEGTGEFLEGEPWKRTKWTTKVLTEDDLDLESTMELSGKKLKMTQLLSEGGDEIFNMKGTLEEITLEE